MSKSKPLVTMPRKCRSKRHVRSQPCGNPRCPEGAYRQQLWDEILATGNLDKLFDQAKKDLGDLDAQFARGDFAPLLGWLRENIHRHGQRYRAPELVQRITGKPLSAEPLLAHLRQNARELYGV